MNLSYQKILFCLASFSLLLIAYYINLSNEICTSPAVIHDNYTYIIGAGTAGCVLAARLSENQNNTVLVIEAGSEFNILSRIPLLSPLLQGSSYDWSFYTEPQQWSSKGMVNKQQRVPRGKGLGGTAQINFMVHGYLELKDLEEWSSLGIERFKENIPKYYNDLFGTSNNTQETEYFRKKKLKNYQIHIQEMKWDLGNVLENAVNESSIPNIKFCKSLSTITKGKRWTTFNGYLKSAVRRPNLHILCDTEVVKILLKNRNAYGVEVIFQGLKKNFYANEVILSAGAINTPKILMLSGIGEGKQLTKLGIPIIEELPGVGKNLHDHLNVPLYVSLKKPISVTLMKVLNLREFFNYILFKEGILGKSPISGMAYSPSLFNIIVYSLGTAEDKVFKVLGNYRSEIFPRMFPFHKNFSQEGFVVLTTCSQPKSRGYISLKTNNYADSPTINPNYLENKYDIQCTMKGLEVLQKLIQTKSFQNVGAKLHWPIIKECMKAEEVNVTEKYLECIIRFTGMTGYHTAGTCKMGHQNNTFTVVDENFRVKHIKNLRVIDTSILPTPVSTFPSSIIIAIAEYATKILESSKIEENNTK